MADPKKILIAEDNDIEAMIIERSLKSAGYQVFRASDGLEALEKYLTQQTFDLLITDVMMPKLGGLELVYHAKEKNCLPPTIVLTANATDEASLKSLQLGAVDHLVKPINIALILAKVQVVLRKAS
jgi:DNA-binding response OmpR family regulator